RPKTSLGKEIGVGRNRSQNSRLIFRLLSSGVAGLTFVALRRVRNLLVFPPGRVEGCHGGSRVSAKQRPCTLAFIGQCWNTFFMKVKLHDRCMTEAREPPAISVVKK
ncbi:uncharacterized protein LOC110037488, partial [Phalaenopsis equestris]|uniref:uncharacterized protein LOC110037488 n=1 Tax=Phalaenopsis equestris TaxID=78828 RepID=UPI0009E1DCD2